MFELGDQEPRARWISAKGAVKGQVNSNGWLAVGVPGTLAGLHLALERYGTLPFSRAVQPALRFAREFLGHF